MFILFSAGNVASGVTSSSHAVSQVNFAFVRLIMLVICYSLQVPVPLTPLSYEKIAYTLTWLTLLFTESARKFLHVMGSSSGRLRL